ncbi:MAG TPA: tetratricopeptide repeat protein [Burkholderiales bacterium]|nr:tetratricopeptide repeat protein [Burkholderiales bacterium]
MSARFGSLLGVGFVFLLVVATIVGIVYVMNMDGIAPPPKPRVVAPIAATTKGGGGAQALAPYARAAAGDAQSQFDLGMLYLGGEGGATKSYAEALKWLELAANGGHADARYNLGVMYKTGLGALQNFELAFQWFELAAGQNHAEAQYNVALMHKLGMSVPIDFVKAYTWANIGAVQGHIGTITLRDNLLQAMTPQQVLEGQRASRDWKPSDEKPKQAPVPAATAAKG